jgi:hypothetical protein
MPGSGAQHAFAAGDRLGAGAAVEGRTHAIKANGKQSLNCHTFAAKGFNATRSVVGALLKGVTST